ncbi:hypothetical protein SAY87_027839 [Trapa incisa]|uniref:Phospholipid/glycerol acyltransferase domain-containing protein n=1 Tax=Trapa incisa TaxID=236973 RepID=A0AAN7JN27_9MYRT|nr:hypothetical protein SAY87_027839 [Trapa incisa]
MFPKVLFFKSIVYFLCRILFGKLRSNNARGLHRSGSNLAHSRYQNFSSINTIKPDLTNRTVVFDLEGALLRSSSPFPYFMLVALEAGSFMRALLLLLTYPLVAFLSDEWGLKVMAFVSFFGVKVRGLRVGSAVLPKFFLEDVGLESFEVLKRSGRKVVVSCLPQVMIEDFAREYLEVDAVMGREMRVICGRFLGVMEEENQMFKRSGSTMVPAINGGEEELLPSLREDDACGIGNNGGVVGLSSLKKILLHPHIFSHCKDLYIVGRADKGSFRQLPAQEAPKPVIFHDGRLAFLPAPLSVVALFMWAPFGVLLSVLRIAIGLTMPYGLSIPILCFSGLQYTVWNPTSVTTPGTPERKSVKGSLFVCNHRTLLDPLCLSFSLKKDLTAVTYSLSRVSEILSPIRTVRLTRDRVKDGAMMESLLRRGDLVVCPEGTTCREPYLLRFSPLFTEMSDDIIPVAVDTSVAWFHGTTAGGLKCFDPLFFFLNPNPIYELRLLEKVSRLSMAGHQDEEKSRFDVANDVQGRIGQALGFGCTGLTRKDKYMILAGNEGIVGNKR